jgi:hypothetical protein
MIEYSEKSNQLQIKIPISSLEKLDEYQQGIRGLLSRIEIGGCDPELKENLKSVYELLSNLRADQSVPTKLDGSLQDLDQTMMKN